MVFVSDEINCVDVIVLRIFTVLEVDGGVGWEERTYRLASVFVVEIIRLEASLETCLLWTTPRCIFTRCS